MLKPLLLGFAAFAVTAAGLAVAQDMPPPPPGGGMMRADANCDGVVTRQEMLDQAGQRFDRLDANHDGKLDRTELERVGRAMRGMRGMGGDMPPPPAPPQQ